MATDLSRVLGPALLYMCKSFCWIRAAAFLDMSQAAAFH